MSRFATTFPRRSGTVTRVARRPPFMTPSPLVPVEGALARPRATPLDHIPPFGREWRFPGAPGARPGRNCLATLTTSCIDVDRPHRTCQWQPLPAAASLPASVGVAVTPAAAAARRVPDPARRPRDRRAMYAVCWSIGALGIIGWLIGAYAPPVGRGPAYALQASGGAAQPATSTHVMPQRNVATPVANTVGSPPATHRVALRPAPRHPRATADVRHAPPASPRRATSQRTTKAPPRTPVVPRLAAHPPIQRGAIHAGTRDRLAPPPRMADTRDTRASLDDPATLIAMTNALRAAQPARPAPPPAAGFDWMSQLSHRRVTDVPEAVPH
ncbi:hypothetical protein CFB46_08930 [Burkholderia sp. HI2761]|nr:hypothetical protein [Burkholderia sp. BE24]OXJ26900.1 hypothetical protein CFB46_08930 [Burkholderia sp. HI2761]